MIQKVENKTIERNVTQTVKLLMLLFFVASLTFGQVSKTGDNLNHAPRWELKDSIAATNQRMIDSVSIMRDSINSLRNEIEYIKDNVFTWEELLADSNHLYASLGDWYTTTGMDATWFSDSTAHLTQSGGGSFNNDISFSSAYRYDFNFSAKEDTTDVEAYYLFNSNSTNLLEDLSGKGHTLAPKGAWDIDTSISGYGNPTRFGSNYLDFENYEIRSIAITNPIVYGVSDDWTVSFWAYNYNYKPYHMILGANTDVRNFIALNNSTAKTPVFRDNAYAWHIFPEVTMDRWHLYTFAADAGTSITMYIDGDSTGIVSGFPTNWTIGNIGNPYNDLATNLFEGYLAYLKIYNKTLTADEVSKEYQSTYQYIPIDVEGKFIVKKESSSSIAFFQRNPNAESKWIGSRLGFHEDVPTNSYGWNLIYNYEYVAADTFNYTFSPIRDITTSGEWECAIKITGEADFMGGLAHGDEIAYADSLWIDGLNKDLTTVENFLCTTMIFKQYSHLFKPSTGDTVASKITTWTMNNDSIDVHHEITWMSAEQLSISYLAMLPLVRTNTIAVQISDSAFTDVDSTAKYIGTSGFTNGIENTGANGGTLIKAWGATSGISAEMSMYYNNIGQTTNAYITNDPAYNKFYIDVTGSYLTSVDEFWETKTSYKFETTNTKPTVLAQGDRLVLTAGTHIDSTGILNPSMTDYSLKFDHTSGTKLEVTTNNNVKSIIKNPSFKKRIDPLR